MMLAAAMALSIQPGAPGPDDPLTCAPRRVISAAGPPPPVFVAERIAAASRARLSLSVHRCPGGGFRVQRYGDSSDGNVRDQQWVPVAPCPALGGWIEAATRLQLPSPMLRPLRDVTSPRAGTWYRVDANTLTGAGWLGAVEIEALDAPGAPPNALGDWFRSGERLFQACRDQGHGGEGFVERRGR